MEGIVVTTVFLNLVLTSISNLRTPLVPSVLDTSIATFFSKVGDGIPDVAVPMRSLDEGLKILPPSVVDQSQNPHEVE